MGDGLPDGGQSTCSYNSTIADGDPDPTQDCTLPGAWHIRISDSGPDLDGFYITCEAHTSQAFQLEGKRQFHEFGPGCGTEGSYWIGLHNTCSSVDSALVMGVFWYECTEALPDPEGLTIGCYARYNGQWYRLAKQWRGRGSHIWLGSKPPPGYNPGEESVTVQPEG